MAAYKILNMKKPTFFFWIFLFFSITSDWHWGRRDSNRQRQKLRKDTLERQIIFLKYPFENSKIMEIQPREKTLWGTGRVVKGGKSKCKIIQALPHLGLLFSLLHKTPNSKLYKLWSLTWKSKDLCEWNIIFLQPFIVSSHPKTQAEQLYHL